MAEQDNFLRGASLGMNAAQAGIQAQQFNQNLQFRKSEAGIQAQQFRTNLSEKARQFDQSYDLDRRATDAAIAQDRLAIRNAAYDLNQKELLANIKNEELEALTAYKEQLLMEYKDPSLEALSMPPALLTGTQAVDAMRFRDSLIEDRLQSRDYRAAEAERMDVESLMANGYLSQDTINAYQATMNSIPFAGQPAQSVAPPVITGNYSIGGGPFGSAAGMPAPVAGMQQLNPLQAARVQRSQDQAKAIAANYGIALPAAFEIETYLDSKGNLKADVLEADVKMQPNAKPSQTVIRNDGAKQTTISNRKPVDKASAIAGAIKAATFKGTMMDEQVNPDALKQQLKASGYFTAEEIKAIAAPYEGGGGGGGGSNMPTAEEVKNWYQQQRTK